MTVSEKMLLHYSVHEISNTVSFSGISSTVTFTLRADLLPSHKESKLAFAH